MTRYILVALLLLAWPLTAEDVLPNADTTATNNDCDGTPPAWSTMDDDPQSPGGDWCTATTNADTLIKVQFATPSTDISTGTNAQTFELYVRKDTTSAPGSGIPTVALDAYNGAVLIEGGTPQNVTSDSGELITETWTSNTSDGSGIEVNIDCQEGGGGPNQRSCDFDAVRWDAALSTGERMMIIGKIKRIETHRGGKQ